MRPECVQSEARHCRCINTLTLSALSEFSTSHLVNKLEKFLQKKQRVFALVSCFSQHAHVSAVMTVHKIKSHGRTEWCSRQVPFQLATPATPFYHCFVCEGYKEHWLISKQEATTCVASWLNLHHIDTVNCAQRPPGDARYSGMIPITKHLSVNQEIWSC